MPEMRLSQKRKMAHLKSDLQSCPICGECSLFPGTFQFEDNDNSRGKLPVDCKHCGFKWNEMFILVDIERREL